MMLNITVTEFFFVSIFCVPLFFIFLYTFKNPSESFLFGRRWMFNSEDIEPSETFIKYYKIISIIGMTIVVSILLFLTISLFI